MSTDVSGIDMNKRILIIYVNKDTLEIEKDYGYWGKYMSHVSYKEPEIPENCVKLHVEENYGLSQIKIEKIGNEYLIVHDDNKDYIEQLKLLKTEIREKRNKMLSETDWTILSDVPLSDEKKTEWKNYRQNLRDITSNINMTIDNYENFTINDIVWPTKLE